jgi:hypothetical protein
MAEFGDFSERTSDEIEHIKNAYARLDPRGRSAAQLDAFLRERGNELSENPDDTERRKHYLVNDPRYEEAVKTEYETLKAAVLALAAFQGAYENTFAVRDTLNGESAALCIAANKIEWAAALTVGDFLGET